MKRILAAVLTALILLIPGAAMAQGGLLPTEPAVTTYTLASAGLTIDLPDEWLVMTSDLGAQSPLAQLVGLGQDEVDAMLLSTGAQLYAMTDLITMGQFFVIPTAGMAGVDMRIGKTQLDMDAFMLGFLKGFTQNIPEESIIDCGSYVTDAAYFARIIYTSVTETGSALSIQYCTNINGQLYVFQYVEIGTTELNEDVLLQLDAAVSSITFPESAQ